LHRSFRRPCGHFLETPDGPDGPDFFFFWVVFFEDFCVDLEVATLAETTLVEAVGAAGAARGGRLADCTGLTILKFTLIN
jgi:hypothetical protein